MQFFLGRKPRPHVFDADGTLRSSGVQDRIPEIILNPAARRPPPVGNRQAFGRRMGVFRSTGGRAGLPVIPKPAVNRPIFGKYPEAEPGWKRGLVIRDCYVG
jgi:hypothetical protein